MDSGAPGLFLDDRVHLFEDVLLMHHIIFADHLSGIQLARLKHLVDQTQKIPAGALHLLQILTDGIRHFLLCERQLQKTQNRRKRCPHVVAHAGQEVFLLLTRFRGNPQRLADFFELLLVVDLLGEIHKRDDQSSEIFLLFPVLSRVPLVLLSVPLQILRLGTRIILLLLRHTVRRDTDQIGLPGHRCRLTFHGFHGIQNLPGQIHQVDGGKIIRDVLQRSSDILLCHIELRGDIFREFADIHIPIHHHDSDQRRGQEICHIVIDGRDLGYLGLILRVHGIQLFIDRLQLFIRALKLLI